MEMLLRDCDGPRIIFFTKATAKQLHSLIDSLYSKKILLC